MVLRKSFFLIIVKFTRYCNFRSLLYLLERQKKEEEIHTKHLVLPFFLLADWS